MQRPPAAFTLIELLVVVTVIVVLLALLAPAMDKAVYRAELAVCGANQHQIGASVIGGATQNKRQYPRRPTLAVNGQPNSIRLNAADDRANLSQSLGTLDSLVCPLAGKIDLAPEATTPSTEIRSSYALWFGYRYGANKAVNRIGDPLVYNDKNYNVLAGDWDFLDNSAPLRALNTHPDKEAKMFRLVVQNRMVNADYTQEGTGGPVATFNRWVLVNSIQRGPTDLNHVFQDGSVVTMNDVLPQGDSRVADVPWVTNDATTTQRIQIPRQ